MSSDSKSNVHQIKLKVVKPPVSRSYEFEDFQLDGEHLMLSRNSQELPLTPKQVETLLALVERRGEIVSKDALMTRLWGDSAVEESNLIQNIYILRKTMGESSEGKPFIETLRRRGYRFNCDLKNGGPFTSAFYPKLEYKTVEAVGSHRETDPFVGRESELNKLKGCLSQAVQGNGQLVFITGEPGIGKTSLATEFLRQARVQQSDLIIGYGRCLEQYGPGEAYLPFLDAFGALLSGPGREFILDALRTHAPTWCLQFPAEFGPIGIFEQLQRDTMGATKERMLREMGDALGALALHSPVVLLIEDLHWADPSSVDLLRHLCQRLSGRRLLIVAALRPEDTELSNQPLKNCRQEMRAHNLCEEIVIESLNTEHLSQYLDIRFAPNDFSLNLVELLGRKTEGHPLFATSLVDHLVERGHIAQIDGRWMLTRQLSEMDIETPESVYSIIRKKVEALDESELRALQYASIEGEEFLSIVVAELLGIDDLALEEMLDHVARVHKLVKACGEKEMPNGTLAIRYRFSHVLYQNFLYDDMATKRRIVLHRQAGELLLKIYGEQAARKAAKLATHFERGRDFARAIEFLVHAGDNAAKVFANDEAERHLSRALLLVEKLPPEHQTSKYTALYHKRGTINQALSRFDQAVGDFTAMLELARCSGLSSVEHAALNAMGTTLFWAHRMKEMSSRIEELSQVVGASENEALKLETMVIMALKHQCYGELAEAKPLYEEVIRVARSIDHKPALLSALTWRSFVHFFQSEYEHAEVRLTEACDLAIELRDGFRLLNCLFCLGMVQGNRGRMSDAIRTFNKAIDMAKRNGDHAVHAKLPNCLGWIYRELQDFDQARYYDLSGVELAREDHIAEAEAHSLINVGNNFAPSGESERSLAAFREAEAVFGRDDWLRWRFRIRHQAGQAEYWLAKGDVNGAKLYANHLLETATRHGVHKYIAVAHKILGEAASKSGNFTEAEEQLKAALNELREYPAPLVAWKTYAALGRLQLKKGECPEAKEAVAQASTIIRQIASEVDDEALRSTFLGSSAVNSILNNQLA
jgi:DNA-binding winged helix-turn-helix (wHTH) protein/tetratricopeptide (TPR) repeat protein